ncbi:T9SS type A sorting domain-containing protein [Terrimonas sp. NA20]|uniref:T9SS type A sorting domain-containing protein n=1 Tax=Terrimonas ginsenosidimutans TaxID=2908004 RepID=A0ABS9KPF2_9BACT|nr:T9SS type A sorting domain-containing protein [Terrimonas ginsenosidimutans]MCG2614213.1 T9SS type A sorting domain-containing protein [Terrimonas ginsenosidimutans]
MMSRITATMVLMITYCSSIDAQQGFYKVFQEKDYHNLADMIVVNENHFAFITSDFFYRIDGASNIILKKAIKHGSSSSSESVICDGEGNFWIALIAFDSQIRPSKVLYKLSPNGQVLKIIDFGLSNSAENLKLVNSSNNTFFLTYKDRGQSGNAAVRALLLDKSGNTIWNKQITDTIYNRYTVKKGANNTVDVYYELKNDRKGQIATIDATGDISVKNIDLIDPVDSDYYTSDFVRANDGIVFCGLDNKAHPLLPDGLIYKTDNSGNVLWQKTLNIKLSDHFYNIEAVADGYIILSISGYQTVASDSEGDIVMIKIDKQGNQLWAKAFGGAKMDYARQLRIYGQLIAFAGQSSYPSSSVSVPFVCKTDLNGDIPSDLPFEPVPVAKMKPIETPSLTYASTMCQSAPGPNESIISGGNFIKTEDDFTYPFVTRSDNNAKQLWYKQLADHPATLKVLKQVRPNEYIAVTEMKDIFANLYDVYKFDETGKIAWTKQVGASAIRDVIATRDGGIILTGTLDISFINFETILIKLDASGNEQWNKKIGDLREWEAGRKIIETPEQDFLIVGSSQPEFNIVSSVYLLKIDRQGNKLWSKTFPEGISTDHGYDVIITSDQGYLLAGSSNKQPFTNKDLLLIRTDKNGNQLWRKAYDLHLMDEGFQLMNSSDGGFLVLGTTAEPQAGPLEKYVYVMKTDANGRNEGVRHYGKRGSQTMNPSMTVLSSGDTVITGTMQDGYGGERLFMTPLEEFTPGSQPESIAINLFPNPSVGSSSLVINTVETGDITIALYDQEGRLIKQISRKKTGLLFKEELSAPSLATGTYFVSVWFNGKRENIKWLIIK